ncbi:sulfite exporter TauE/SafE family protein [Neobacillus sp. MER 74]|uniref:HoxN/HupN/NixA family nickel/cobalt transporter n=1 Tax=Bacillaceae TaxID=186817 RepID=UPI000BF8BFA8|nr:MULTISPECIES: sulfite exporter TauE/SafE family protein [Bacillaceae]MCM3117966.1 sulfite exporter TauE/SafE family protein [Neobacillus sp. MER 74]PFP17573.1 urease accessory protein UreH [Bacillus sp. AFS073361]
MTGTLLSILLLGFLLGIKHAIEPDHVIAVSTIVSESKNIKRSVFAGVYWGIGHTATLFLFGMILIVAKNTITDTVALSLEFIVGIMLVSLGLNSLLSFMKHRHPHPHHTPDKETKGSTHLKSFFIGLIHGLAGSAAMVLLTMSTVSTAWQGALYILIFGCGTIVGMLTFSTVIGIPFVLTSGKQVNRYLNSLAGIVSILFGIYYMYNLGVNEGLFSMWFS